MSRISSLGLKPLCLAGATLLGAGFVPAGAAEWEQRLSRSYATCIDNAQGVTASMIECIGDEMKGQDSRLNASYRSLIRALPPDRQDKVKQAQRRWLDFRQLNCDALVGSDTGSLATIEANECMLRMTVERTAELERMAEP